MMVRNDIFFLNSLLLSEFICIFALDKLKQMDTAQVIDSISPQEM
jgi:hypothetical protein